MTTSASIGITGAAPSVRPRSVSYGHAHWYFLGPFTFYKGNRQLWLAARYEDDYVKINGIWKFKHLRAFGRMAAPYEEGWASQAKVDVFSN